MIGNEWDPQDGKGPGCRRAILTGLQVFLVLALIGVGVSRVV